MSNVRLEAGELSPYFKTVDVSDNTVDLKAYRGKRVVLSFYRFVTCPLCNFRIAQFMNMYNKIANDDVVVIAVFESSKEYITDYVGPKGIPFPIIADPNGVLYRHFGVELSWTKSFLAMLRPISMMKAMWSNKFRMGPLTGKANRVPADFLIEKDGTISVSYYGSDINDHLALAKIEEFITGSPEAPAKPRNSQIASIEESLRAAS